MISMALATSANRTASSPFDESYFLGAILKNIIKTRSERFPGGVFLIDLYLPAFQDLDDNRFLLNLVRLLSWLGGDG